MPGTANTNAIAIIRTAFSLRMFVSSPLSPSPKITPVRSKIEPIARSDVRFWSKLENICSLKLTAMPPKADKQQRSRDVRFVPKPDSSCGAGARHLHHESACDFVPGFCDSYAVDFATPAVRGTVGGRRVLGATGLSLACHPIQMLLDHAQVDAEPIQVELEWRSNFQPAHGGFDLGEPSLMLGQLSFVLALCELALESSQRPVQSHDTTNGQPAIKARRKADDGEQPRGDRHQEEAGADEQRGERERRGPLPEWGAWGVDALRSRRERQIVGLLGGKLPVAIERHRRRVNFADRFQQQIL